MLHLAFDADDINFLFDPNRYITSTDLAINKFTQQQQQQREAAELRHHKSLIRHSIEELLEPLLAFNYECEELDEVSIALPDIDYESATLQELKRIKRKIAALNTFINEFKIDERLTIPVLSTELRFEEARKKIAAMLCQPV